MEDSRVRTKSYEQMRRQSDRLIRKLERMAGKEMKKKNPDQNKLDVINRRWARVNDAEIEYGKRMMDYKYNQVPQSVYMAGGRVNGDYMKAQTASKGSSAG